MNSHAAIDPCHLTTTASPADILSARVADLAAGRPETIRVFQRHKIDFCCGGQRTVAEAAGRAGLAPDRLAEDLAAALEVPDRGTAWLRTLPDSLADLAKLIVGRYHVALRAELPRLVQMANRVEEVHGAHQPHVLPPLAAHVRALAAELMRHMREEEGLVFPAIERLESDASGLASAAAGDLDILIEAREDEHAAAGEHLRALRALSSDYSPPDWACNTFRGLYFGLAELERDLHEHIHLENNVLFPRALALAAAT